MLHGWLERMRFGDLPGLSSGVIIAIVLTLVAVIFLITALPAGSRWNTQSPSEARHPKEGDLAHGTAAKRDVVSADGLNQSEVTRDIFWFADEAYQ